jgi:hypothetical protein
VKGPHLMIDFLLVESGGDTVHFAVRDSEHIYRCGALSHFSYKTMTIKFSGLQSNGFSLILIICQRPTSKSIVISLYFLNSSQWDIQNIMSSIS